MKRYIQIYKTLLLLNWNALLAYRSDLFTRILSGCVFSSYHIVTILLITNGIQSAFGWARHEMLLLAATYSVFIGIFHTFVSRNLSNLADDIYFGRLDFMLLKPVDAHIGTMLWTIDYLNLLRTMYGVLLSVYILNTAHVLVRVEDMALYILFLFLGIAMLASIWILLLSIVIYVPRISNIVTLLFNLSNVGKYPQEMYKHMPVLLASAMLPLALMMTTPTKALIGAFTWSLGIEVLLLTLGFILLSRYVWLRSLRHYTSASS